MPASPAGWFLAAILLVDVACCVVTQDAKFVASDGRERGAFGQAVATSADGKTFIVGSPGDGPGSAYVYMRNVNGSFLGQKLPVVDGSKPNDRTGTSVDISGSGQTAIVGSFQRRFPRRATGAVYVFTRTASDFWEHQETLVPEELDVTGCGFAVTIDTDGKTIFMGCPGGAAAAGLVEVYERQPEGSWSRIQKLAMVGGVPRDTFGASLSVTSSTALVGNYEGDMTRGSVSVLERQVNGTWEALQKLYADDGSTGDFFGFSVGVAGDTAVAGSIGAAYVFQRHGGGLWTKYQKLEAPSGDDRFGFAVSISDDGRRVLIGAFSDSDYKGAAYLFERDLGGFFQFRQKLVASDGAGSHFGYALSMSGDGSTAVIGGPAIDDDTGAVFLFNHDSEPVSLFLCERGADRCDHATARSKSRSVTLAFVPGGVCGTN